MRVRGPGGARSGCRYIVGEQHNLGKRKASYLCKVWCGWRLVPAPNGKTLLLGARGRAGQLEAGLLRNIHLKKKHRPSSSEISGQSIEQIQDQT